MFNFLGTTAAYFLDLNRERTLEGLKAALARGRKGGRRHKLSAAEEAVARAILADPTIPVAAIAKRLGGEPGDVLRLLSGSPHSRSEISQGAGYDAV